MVILLLLNLIFGETLLERLPSAKKGDYFVMSHSGCNTVLTVQNKRQDTLVIEEISVPSKLAPRKTPWKAWIEAEAPRHTGWTAYGINIKTGAMEWMYSFNRNSWMQVSPENNIFSRLVNLEFSPLAEQQRRHIGTHQRKLWSPQLRLEGELVPGVVFNAYTTLWPQDNSELSGKTVTMYLPHTGQAPNYFPYWVEVVAQGQIRVIDAGRNMKSPQTLDM